MLLNSADRRFRKGFCRKAGFKVQRGMTEGRRRRIIKSSTSVEHPPEAFRQQEEVYEAPAYAPAARESLLDKKIYIPVPMIFAGLLGIMAVSFLATWLVVKWPGPSLDLPENAKIQAFREAAEPLAVPERAGPEKVALAIDFPEASVEVASFRRGLPVAIPTPERVSGTRFAPDQAKPVRPPVARLAALETAGSKPRIEEGISLPRERAGVSPTGVLDISPPVADVAVTSFRQAFDIPKPDAISQKLLARRYAKGAEPPNPAGNVDPLTTPVAGDERRLPSFSSPADAGAPVTDLILEAADLPAMSPRTETPGQKLMARRFAKAVTGPELDSPLGSLSRGQRVVALTDPVAVPAEGETGTLAKALGVRDPAADLVVAGSSPPETLGRGQPLGQKLMPRRYAKATGIPEQIILPGEEQAPVPETPVLRTEDQTLEPWRRYAAAVPPGIEGRGRIVIIIDDMGNNLRMAERLAGLQGPLNFAFLPYAPNLERQTSLMRQKGHELLVHMPMEPTGDENPGPRALTTSLDDKQLMETLEWNLTRFEGFVGVNNHMGSRFTSDRRRMDMVMKSLKERGLLFLDSLTTNDSDGVRLARRYNIPWAGRDVFLDNEVDEAAILAQLEKVEELANRRGVAIAIGHPHSATLRALEKWIPTLAGKGLVLVPLSSAVHFDQARKLAGGGN